jgi:hypothetical protein
MSLIKFAFLIALILTGTAKADEVKCPPFQGKNSLSGAIVFDGPPEEMADLIPDESKGSDNHANSSWQVAYIYESGRNVYLVCKYTGTKDTITIKAEKKVQTCIYRTYPNKPAEMFCQ